MAGIRQRMNLELAMAVLAAAAGLANVFPFGCRAAANRFAISDLRPADAGLHAKFPQHAIDDNFEMQFAHAGNQGLSGIRIGMHAEGGVFLRELPEGVAELILIGLGVVHDRHGDDLRVELYGLQNYGLLLVAKRVAGGHTLQAYAGGNVARIDGVYFLALVCMHAQEAADTLARELGSVVDVAAGLQDSRIHPDIGEVSDKRVGHDLECQRRKRLVIARAAQKWLGAIKRSALYRRNVERRRQVINYGVEQRLDALVLERGTGHDGHQLQRDGRAANRGAQLFGFQFVFGKVLRQDGIVMFGDVFDHFLAMLFIEFRADRRSFNCRHDFRSVFQECLIPKLADREFLKLRAEGVFKPDDYFLLDEIDDSNEAIFLAERKLQGNRVGTEPLAHGTDTVVEIGAHAVHLVDKGKPRHAILIGLPPHRLRLRLYTGNRVENGHCAIEHTQRSLHLHGEIHMPRRINDIDPVRLAEAFPAGRRRRGGNGNAAFALLFHPVHRGGAFIDFADFVGHTGVKEDAFGGRRFAGVDMRHDADIARVPELCPCFHGSTKLFRSSLLLPAVMGEGFISLSHAVHVLFALDGAAAPVGRV